MLPLPRTIAEPETAATERGTEPGTSQKAPDDVKQTQQLPLDAPPIRVAGDVESEDEANTTPGPPVSADPAHNMTIAVYRAPSLFSSEDPSSSGGSSLTLPTVATLDALPIPRPMRPPEWPELPLYPEFDEEIRKTPFEVHIEPPSKSLIIVTTQQSPQHLSCHSFRPWKFEFWWQNGTLHSSGSTLKSVLKSSHRSRSGRFSGATAGSSNGISESSHASTVLMVAPPAGVPLHIAVHDEDQVYWTTRQRRGELVGMLKDHFWRTHGPQGADGPNGETSPHCPNYSTPVPYATAMTARSSARGWSSRRLLNGRGSGSGGDDDPHDGDDGRSRPLEGLVFKRTRHFACPFQKWRPQRFKHCLQRHRNVCDVKRHISEKHYIPRCPRCHTCWRTPVARTEHYHNNSCRERPISLLSLGCVSEQQLAIIRRRPGRKSREQQWRDIFNIIFPDEPQPQDVYFDRRADDTMHRIAHQYDRCCRHFLLNQQAELARENPFLDQFESLEAQREAVAELYVPSLMVDFDGQGTSGWSPPFPLRIDSQIHDNHGQSQVHGVPLTLDSLGRAHRESTGPYDTPQSRPSVVPSLPFNWNIAPPLNPHILPDVSPATLGYEPMDTNLVEQQPPMVPQPGQDFDLLLHHQPIEDILAAFDSQFANNNSNTLLQPAFHGNSPGLSMDAFISADSSFLPEIQGLAPVPAAAGGSLSAPTPADASFDYGATSPLTTFVQPYIQWPDAASETPSLFNSSTSLTKAPR